MAIVKPKPVVMNTMIKKTGYFLTIWVLLAGLVIALASGCTKESKGFALPEGDVESGKASFVALNCNACHSIADIKWAGEDKDLKLPLGGKTSRIKTYGELVTSVINPSHKISKAFSQELTDSTGHSKMKIYNDVLTVQDLVDIVTFLQTQYEVVVPERHYPQYQRF
jgi:hypothetical protein